MGFFKVVTGVMGCGKSTRYISDYKALTYRNCAVIGMKSSLDTRDSGEIKSRNMAETVKVDYLIDPSMEVPVTNILLDKVNYIMVDEAQFLTKQQVQDLYRLTTASNLNVILYGLRMCWKGVPFESMQLALGLADDIEVIRVYNARGEELTHQIITIGGKPLEIDPNGPEIYIGDVRVDKPIENADGKSVDGDSGEILYHTVTKSEFYSIYRI